MSREWHPNGEASRSAILEVDRLEGFRVSRLYLQGWADWEHGHALLAFTLGINQMICCCNKILVSHEDTAIKHGGIIVAWSFAGEAPAEDLWIRQRRRPHAHRAQITTMEELDPHHGVYFQAVVSNLQQPRRSSMGVAKIA